MLSPSWHKAAPIQIFPKQDWQIPTDAFSDTLILAHWLGWFGLDTHRQLTPSLISTDTNSLKRQVEDAKSMGINGFSIGWYGPVSNPELLNSQDRAFIDQATQNLFDVATSIVDFKLVLIYDYNTLRSVLPELRTAQMISDLTYAKENYFSQNTYLTHDDIPLVFLFSNNDVKDDVDLAEVKAALNIKLIYQNPTDAPAIVDHVDGSFAWVQPDKADIWSQDGSDWGGGYLDWFYRTMKDENLAYSQTLTVGAVWPGFNDTLAPWQEGAQRFISQRNGQTWKDSWALAIEHQPPIVQIVTWNDHEELTAIEPDTSLGTWKGTTIHSMDVVTPWITLVGTSAISIPELSLQAGRDDGAIAMSYHLSQTASVTADNWIQTKIEFTSPLTVAGDHIRIYHTGTTTNSLQIGVVSGGTNYFSVDMNRMTNVPWWTYTTWDLQSVRADGQKASDLSEIDAFFASVKRSHENDAGGIGTLTLDGLQFLNLASREIPAEFEFIDDNMDVAEKAVTWIASQQQENGLLKSWSEEKDKLAWLYDQALALIVLTDTNPELAAKLVDRLHKLQNSDGSWNSGYRYNGMSVSSVQPASQPIGANAWVIYALAYYATQNCSCPAVQNAAKDAQRGALWLAGLQRADGSLPDIPGSQGTPTEPNLDVWWAFKATGLDSNADALRDFLLAEVWDPEMGRFKASPQSFEIFLDNQTWGASFLIAIGHVEDARRALSYAYETLATCASDGLICGMDGAGPFSVWNEGTLQYIAAGGKNSQYFWGQMIKQQSPDGSMPGSPDSYFGSSVWLTKMHGIAPAAWLYFAGTQNPLKTDFLRQNPCDMICCIYLPTIYNQ
ncbi:MAG: hypothetical protein KDE50_28450 [Caldilineaceae bacterium]|nr:hypothetical protein [Caldilineaceae bacterium]